MFGVVIFMKNKITTNNWKRFNLYDESLFIIDTGNKFDKSKMSIINPSVNFIGRSSVNNGITCVVDTIKDVKPYKAGNMTVALGGEYLGSCFIQENDFYTSQNVNVLIPRWEMSFYVKKFISLIIFKESRTYYKAFEDELNRHMTTDFSILLPVDSEGIPNWTYMEEYMKNVEDVAQRKIDALSYIKGNSTVIDSSAWKDFELQEIFYIQSPEKRFNANALNILEEQVEGSFPYVIRSQNNNGIKGYIVEDKKYLSPRYTFSLGQDTGTIFFQEKNYFTGDKIKVLTLKDYVPNLYTGLFLISIIKIPFSQFRWGVDSFDEEILKKVRIKLPVNANGEPDFNFMEKYIRALESKSKSKINILKTI